MTERARKRRAKRKKVLKAHSKSEIKRLFAMGIEADVHPDWCAIESLGMCTCGAATQEEEPDECKAPAIVENPPASEASGRCDDPYSAHGCCKRPSGTWPEVFARQHIEAIKLLQQACIKLTAARKLLGDKGA